jgi:hypothetical protein
VDELPNSSCWALPGELLVVAVPRLYRHRCHRRCTSGCLSSICRLSHSFTVCCIDPYCRMLFHCCDNALHTLCASTALAPLSLLLLFLRLHSGTLLPIRGFDLFHRLSPVLFFLGGGDARPRDLLMKVSTTTQRGGEASLMSSTPHTSICFSGRLRMVGTTAALSTLLQS